jgi:hypothetical protein
MKKSMIATAVVATAGLAASANAGYWTISGANYVNGGTNNIAVSSLENQVNTWVSANLPGSPLAQTNLSTTGVTNSLTNLNVTLADNTLTYFGFEDAVTGPGFFGIALKNTTGSTYYMNMTAGSQAANGSEGVITSHTGTVIGGGWGASIAITTGSTVLVMFGGLNAGQSFQYQAESVLSDGASSGGQAFAISYLNWGGTGAYSEVASAGSATSSGLNTALYAVPVPAPALLAGAGLVGAAALRRRMAKKA